MPTPNNKSDYMLGALLAGGMVFNVLIGYYIGLKTDTVVISTLVGAFVGIVFCGYEIWKEYRRNQNS